MTQLPLEQSVLRMQELPFEAPPHPTAVATANIATRRIAAAPVFK
jgi:hypothetical protein